MRYTTGEYAMFAYKNQLISPILASRDKAKLDWWRKGLHGFANLHEASDLSQLKDNISQFRPEMLLIDYELLGAEVVPEICSLKKQCPEVKMVVLTNTHSEKEECSLLRAGVRGCCQWNVESSNQQMLVQAIHQGELWFRRSLTNKLLEQLEASRNNKAASVDSAC